jgi:hypothetical protein
MNRERREREHTWEGSKKENGKNTALMWTEIF